MENPLRQNLGHWMQSMDVFLENVQNCHFWLINIIQMKGLKLLFLTNEKANQQSIHPTKTYSL